MEEWLNLILRQLVIVVISGVCSYLVAERKAMKSLEKRQEERARLYSEAIVLIMRNTIQHVCKERIEQGWVDLDEQATIKDCHNVYEKIIQFEGMTNGKTEGYMEKFEGLPNSPANKKR